MAGYEDFVHLGYKPKPTDLLVSFRVHVPSWETPMWLRSNTSTYRKLLEKCTQ